MKIKFTEIKLEVPLIMEHFYDFTKNDFIHWQTKLTQFAYTSGTPYFSIFVNTIDSLRYSYLLEALCCIQKNILVTGETGVGKSSIINNSIKKLLLTEEYSSIIMNFSAQTTSEDTQRNLEAKLDKKKGKKLLGGKNGKRVLIFIDDVNMPEPTEFNSHPPIELLRQYLDFGEIYDRQKYFLKKIEDVSMIIAGGPPIGGRSKLTTRFTRHYTQLCIPQAGKEILISIFENILKGFTSEERFSDEVKKLSLDVTLSTIDIYEIVCKTMKPIPAKFHYSFNLRDVSKVFQGLLMVKNKSVKNGNTFAKLWVHEVMRIFGDRLINNEDLKNLQDNVVFLVKNKLKCNDLSNDNLFKVPVYFGQIHKGDLKDGIEKPYEEIGGSDEDRNLLRKKLSYYLEIYNKNFKKNQLNLVFFDYAINHIVRITRVLRQPRGNIVLIGQGGTGKQVYID
jgi:dynein heavy chain